MVCVLAIGARSWVALGAYALVTGVAPRIVGGLEGDSLRVGLALTALVATTLPALRASRADPVEVMKTE